MRITGLRETAVLQNQQQIQQHIDQLVDECVRTQLPSASEDQLDIAARILKNYGGYDLLEMYAYMRREKYPVELPVWRNYEQPLAELVVKLEAIFPEHKSPEPTYWSERDAYYKRTIRKK